MRASAFLEQNRCRETFGSESSGIRKEIAGDFEHGDLPLFKADIDADLPQS